MVAWKQGLVWVLLVAFGLPAWGHEYGQGRYADYPPGYPFGANGQLGGHVNGYDGWPGDTPPQTPGRPSVRHPTGDREVTGSASTVAEDAGGVPFTTEDMEDKAAVVPVRGMVATEGTELPVVLRIRTADRVVVAVTGEGGAGCRATEVTVDTAGRRLATEMPAMVVTVVLGAVLRTFRSIAATQAGAAVGAVMVATLRGPGTEAMEGMAATVGAAQTRPVAKAAMAGTVAVRSTGPVAKEVMVVMEVLRRRSVGTEGMVATGATVVRSVAAVKVETGATTLGSTTPQKGTRVRQGLVRAIPLLLGGTHCSSRRKSASGPSF